MRKILKIVSLILAFSCILSVTSFATTYDKDDYIEVWPHNIPGDVLVTLKADIPKVDDYASLLPELDIARIKRVIVFENGEVFLSIILTELTEQATLDAIEALQNNEYVKGASANRTSGNAFGQDPLTILRGDVNGDDAVTNSDLVILAQFIVYSDDYRAYLMISADMNDDGFITNSDLVTVAKKIVDAA